MQNLQSLSQLLADWQAFADKIMPLIKRLGLERLGECDHAALRVNSVAAAEKLKAEFAQCGEIISENIINGRPILIIRLQQPLLLGQWQIPCVELPFPGDNTIPKRDGNIWSWFCPMAPKAVMNWLSNCVLSAPGPKPHSMATRILNSRPAAPKAKPNAWPTRRWRSRLAVSASRCTLTAFRPSSPASSKRL